ncbi:response regulator transcription factor [Leifsonia shinshuensis]|uniref:DNA-binding NarL/FixJ family response regulator n=1 Tax=Leifsonia shinshuensis TaxID=150026 RepID=A0A853D309_9MICO|nr:response regulator transcription factor [Leifsonia shinshuensis]NYJ25774.1 DNA-binding NarL/FixJ family response regulator [Leifsonia shinshuensis]
MTRTVVLADDHALFRQGVRALIERDFDVVGEASDGNTAIRLVEETTPDVLLLDVEMPGPPTEQTIRTVRRRSPRTAVVILTMHTDAVLQRQLTRAGASAFANKSISETALRQLIAAAQPLAATPPDDTSQRNQPDGVLTERELEVIRMIAQAYTNREISTRLNITEGTVKRHTTNIYAKLGATSRIDAVRKVVRLNLLET